MPNAADQKTIAAATVNNQIFTMHTDTGNWHSLSASTKPLTGKGITGSDIGKVVENKLR
ncbi:MULTISPECIES: hypothetical protein [Photorhabdus]|uniref:Uncharacterized protein n=1 Tax=Photorhabdus asymbiotica TaxID=291112 RepID=A0ABX9SPD0_9GAMM|nr:hypothetical protein [Photorhabdus asymbiotica]RKS59906.1 hypothetical protein BDD30_2006 [Photorhabdus asymbiotica]